MGRTVGWAVAVTLGLALGVGGCGGDDDERGSTTPRDDPSRDSGDAQAYRDAIAATTRHDDPDNNYDFLLSEEASACYGEAYVEVVTVERLAAKVTADEVLASPEKDIGDWGIEVTDAEGTEIFRSLVDCAPRAMEEISQLYATQLGSSGLDLGLDAACLAQAGPAAIEDFVGGSIARSAESGPTEEQARSMVDWLWPCGDLRGALLGSMTSDLGLSEATTECINAAVDDEAIRNLVVAVTVLGESEIEDSPGVAALMAAVDDCEPVGT